MKGRISFIALGIVSLLLSSTASVFAVTPPDFPACSSQVGAPILASYENGTHGIPGDSTTYTGSDTVYAVDSNNKVLQCFCADNGGGIQTTWWKVSSLSDSEIKVLVNAGWHYIQNGSIWGLADAPYVAKNSSYTCKGGIGGGESILGLAGTGNTTFLYNLVLFATAVTGSAILLLKFPKKHA